CCLVISFFVVSQCPLIILKQIIISDSVTFACRNVTKYFPSFKTYLSSSKMTSTHKSNSVTFWITFLFLDAELTLIPNRSLYFVGENVILLCNMNESNGENWEYELIKDGSEHVAYSEDARFEISLTFPEAGSKYQCIGRHKTDSKTKMSKNCNVAVAGEPLSFTRNVFATEQLKHPLKNDCRCVIKATGNILDATYSVKGEGVYWCRGGRGDPLYFTEYSEPVTIENTVSIKAVATMEHEWRPIYIGEVVTLRCNVAGTEWDYEWISDYDKSRKGARELKIKTSFSDYYSKYKCRGIAKHSPLTVTQWNPHPSVSLTVHPNRVQHFRIDPVSISCEGFSTQWRLMRCNVHTKVCRVVGNTMNSIFKLDENDLGIEGVYWCESDIAFSNAVNVTGRDDIILLSPAVPVLEGEKVILGCRTKLPIPRINFYKDHKVIFSVAVTKPREANMVISAISKSDKGFYKCGDAQTVSLQSWVSVTGTDHLIVCYCVLSIGFIHPKNMKHGIDWIV
uniref:Ig-like domain-containing protein n=1 Tax=Gouania willdenowi TaxID=441366 RepID=A0A8C5GLM0_GOUWI